MPMRAPILITVLGLAASVCGAADRAPRREVPIRGALIFENPDGVPKNYRLVHQQTFEGNGAIRQFVFSDPKAWRVSPTGTNSALELFGKSNYNPKHRSPFNIALLADKTFGDFVLDVELASTVKPYGHQDMCLFFGFENTNRFYYAHIAVAADPHAHNIFIVNDAPRTAIAKQTTKGITWNQNMPHLVRLERKVSDGTIKVYFDDFAKPIMVAEDRTFGEGYIGFGSFDDMGRIDNIRIYAPSAPTRPAPFFQRAED